MSESKVLPCTCESRYQDEAYGEGRRVHNEMKATKDKREWRCTVCGKEK